MDETYVGGRAPRGQDYTGRYTPKQIVIGIRQRNGELRMFKAKDVKAGTIAQFIRENISGGVDVIMTDDFASYPFAMERAGIPRTRHETINHSGRVYVMGDIHTNTVESAFSLLKRGVMDDRIDARKLASLLRGGLLSAVYHGENGVRTLKELARSYLAITQDLTRVMNRLKALYRSWAIPCAGEQVYAPRHRNE
jgi:hypothetical protein